MTSFVHPTFPTEHLGVTRAINAVNSVQHATKRFDGARSLATVMLAAIVSALMVVANQVIEAWTDGHLLVVWMALWLVAFAAMALLASPARQAARSLRTGYAAWQAKSLAAAQDRQLWQHAQSDSRVMAEIEAAMSRHHSGA